MLRGFAGWWTLVLKTAWPLERRPCRPLGQWAAARGSSEGRLPDPEREPHLKREMVGLSGLEPLTSRLSGGRSNQLSYRPEDLTCLVLQSVFATV